jgi:hypothetical protein
MLKPGAVAREIMDGTETTIHDFRTRIIKQETMMTERLFGSVANSLNGKQIGGACWKAYSLTSGRGRAAEETRHGADVLGVLNVDLPDFKTKKGFLLQAKIAEPDLPLSNSEWDRFQKQCRLMLKRTHEAFGVVYSRQDGVRFIPAQTILEIGRDQLFEVGFRSIYGFFKSHVKCEIGDRRLNAPNVDVLDALAKAPSALPDEFGVNNLIGMKATKAT